MAKCDMVAGKAEDVMNRIFIGIAMLITLAGFSVGSLKPADNAVAPRQLRLLDDGWKFHLGEAAGAGETGFDDRDWRSVNLPHDWSIEGPFDAKFASGTGYLPGGIGWYRKSFPSPVSSVGKRIGIRFDGVYCNSEVWINGRSLGKHPSGYTSFEYDLTPHLVSGNRQNVLAVRVDHSKFGDSRWYTGSGIYRHVWMTITGEIHVASWGTLVTTPKVTAQSATIAIATRAKNEGTQAREVTLLTDIQDGAGKSVGRAETKHSIQPGEEFRFEQSVDLANPKLWAIDNPYLYSVQSSLRIAGSVMDEYATTFGIRSILFDPNRGFFLNGKPTVLQGVCIHHDAGSLGAAVPDRALERRLRLLKELGCNAIRTSHNPPAPELLDMCDRMGFLVMDEAFDEWAKPKKKWIEGWNAGKPGLDGYAESFDQWAIRDIQSMVERDKNHPSIILWSIGNEIDYDRDPYYDPESKGYTPDKPSAKDLPVIASTLIKAVKEIDRSRPVTAALANITVSNRTGLADLLDVVGYNYLEKYYEPDHKAYPARKMVGSENSHAYASWAIVKNLNYAVGQFLWTGFDYLGEARAWPVRSSGSGVLDECGFKKPSFYFRQSLWSEKPMVYVAARASARSELVPSWNWPVKDGDPVTVVAYSNCEKVELLLNGKSLGEKLMSSGQDHVLSWEVPYSAGTLRAVGKNGNVTANSWELKTAGQPARIRLNPDVAAVAADGRDLVHVEVSIVDAAGNPVFAADPPITFELTGSGRILGVDSGDLRSHEDFKARSRKAYQGRCLVIVQSMPEAGLIRLKAAAPGLAESTITITARKR
jgi:beta-galactosidase